MKHQLDNICFSLIAEGSSAALIKVYVTTALKNTVKYHYVLVSRSPKNHNIALVAIKAASNDIYSGDFITLGFVALHNFKHELSDLVFSFLRVKLDDCTLDFSDIGVLEHLISNTRHPIDVYVPATFSWRNGDADGKKVIVRTCGSTGSKE